MENLTDSKWEVHFWFTVCIKTSRQYYRMVPPDYVYETCIERTLYWYMNSIVKEDAKAEETEQLEVKGTMSLSSSRL